MFAVFTWTNTAAWQETPKKQTMVMKIYKELLGTSIKSKKIAYINTVCTKSASKAFSMSVLTCATPWSSQTNIQEII